MAVGRTYWLWAPVGVGVVAAVLTLAVNTKANKTPTALENDKTRIVDFGFFILGLW